VLPNYAVWGDWYTDDIWFVAWGGSTIYHWPLPDIYDHYGTLAGEWYTLSKYGYTYHSSTMVFKGSLTQWSACQTNPCGNLDATPIEGWDRLFNTVNKDPITRQNPGAASDITYIQ
jgi:hypothetical protein